MTIIDTIITMLAPRKVRWSLAFLCFAFAGFVFWRDLYPILRDARPTADPVYYADGSVEYTLFDSSIGKDKNPRELSSWVLRLPDLIECRQAANDGTCKSYRGRHPSLSYEKLPSYESLSWYVHIEDFSIFRKFEDGLHSKTVWVSPTGKVEPLFEKTHSSRTGGPAERGFGKIVEWDACKVVEEIAPNFHQVRQATDEEINREFIEPPQSYKVKCSQAWENRDGYRLQNSEGRQIAYGHCPRGKRTSTKKFKLCTFIVWVPQERSVGLNFDRQHVRKFPEIYQKLVSFLADATIAEKSRDMKWRPSEDD